MSIVLLPSDEVASYLVVGSGSFVSNENRLVTDIGCDD